MNHPDQALVFFIVLTVLLFIGLGVAILILIDHKAKIPGGFVSNPFSIIGMRRDHPVISFLTAVTLIAIIACLFFELTVTLAENMGFMKKEEQSNLLLQLHEQRYTEKMRHFHNVPRKNLVELGKKQACFYCHGDYPHSKERMVRTLLNMHTQFIGCVTCHANEEKINEKNYRFGWLNYSGISVTGPPFGTSYDPDTGNLVQTDDYYSKIVIYDDRENPEKLLELTEDDPEVQEFAALAASNRLSNADREGLKERFHILIKNKGRHCSVCHTSEDKSYLPFRSLGFSERRIRDMTNLNIIGIVEKYREFYLPDLMKSKIKEGNSQETPRSGSETEASDQGDG